MTESSPPPDDTSPEDTPPDNTRDEDAATDGPGATTTTEPPPASRLRSVTGARRCTEDRLLGGVSTGLARHLDIDPVIVRIVFAVLTLIGGAGIIVYAAAWFLLPTDASPHGVGDDAIGPSVAAEWFGLDENEEKVRVGGLVLAGVVSVLAIVGDSGWGPGLGGGWVLIPLAALVWWFVIRPRQRATTKAERREGADDVAGEAATSAVEDWNTRRREKRAHRSFALTGLTVSIVAIAMAVTRLVADSNGGTSWTTYVLVALTVIGIAVLLSMFIGDGGPLIWVGLALVIALGVGSSVPNLRIGEVDVAPRTAADVESRYTHGIGHVRLDLSEVEDPEALLGRSITVDTGIGQTTVVVPNGLNVTVDADLQLGEATILGRTVNGNDNQLISRAEPGRTMTLTIEHTVGNIEVIRQ